MSEPIEVTSVADLAALVAARHHPADSSGNADGDGVDGRGRRLVIAIAGPPGGGKSTTAEALVEMLNANVPDSAAVFPMDGYHFDDAVLDARGHRARKGAPHTFDVAGFAHMLGRLRANDEAEIAVPVFDRSTEVSRAGARIIPRSITRLVVEGNYLLLDLEPWSDLARYFDLTVFIDVPESELRRRLRRRWADLAPAEADAKLEGNDLPNARLVKAKCRRADVVLRPID